MATSTLKNIEKARAKNGFDSRLPMDSLQILRYRCFEHLTIERLGRVNLIVGRNNVGKTALLEALWIFANGGSGLLMYEILKERNEIPPPPNGMSLSNSSESIKGIRNLLFARPDLGFIPGEYPGELDSGLNFIVGENIDISGDEQKPVNKMLQISCLRAGSHDSLPQLKINAFLRTVDNYFIKAGGLTDEKLVEFWDNIEKWVLEDLVIEALKIVVPSLSDIRFSGYPNGSFSRVPVVRLANAKERVPLRSLGEGMRRLLGVASALINCRDGILLIDEIESGLHYSVLPDIWRLIFKTAKDLNVQVFATTHSSDCVEAFAQAVNDSPDEGMLIRLERHGEKIVAKSIAEDMLVEAVNYEVEVR